MQFIRLGFIGRNNFLSYLATFLLTVTAIVGPGMVPYTIAVSRAGFPVDKAVSAAEIIAALGENTFLALQLFPFVFALFVLMLCVRFIHKRPVLTLFTSRKSFDWKRFFVSFFAWGFLMGLLLLINAWFFGNQYIWNLNPATFGMLLAISLFLIPVQTTFEEAMFRGNLFQGFGTFFRKGWITVVFTGCFFGLIHGSNPEVSVLGLGILTYYVITGIFLGLLALMDDGLELSMGFHAMNNIFGALVVTNSWQVFQSDALWMDTARPSFGWDTIASMAICFPLLTLFFAKVYRWNSWRERLFGTIEKDI